jgi:hypothetical protein
VAEFLASQRKSEEMFIEAVEPVGCLVKSDDGGFQLGFALLFLICHVGIVKIGVGWLDLNPMLTEAASHNVVLGRDYVCGREAPSWLRGWWSACRKAGRVGDRLGCQRWVRRIWSAASALACGGQRDFNYVCIRSRRNGNLKNRVKENGTKLFGFNKNARGREHLGASCSSRGSSWMNRGPPQM